VEVGGLDRRELLRLWGWRLWAFYRGQPVWAGFPTGLDDEGGSAVTVSFTELIGYTWRKQHAMTASYRQREQMEILGNLAARLENIGVRYRYNRGPGKLRDRDYGYLEGTSRGELMENLAGVIDGPEFRSEYEIDATSGRPQGYLTAGFPRVGRDTGLGLAIPGEGVAFRAHWSTEMSRTRTFAVGELPEDAPVNARRPVVMVYNSQFANGIPNYDVVDDYPGVILRSTLQERANTNAAIYKDPTLELSATVSASLPPLGTYGVGDSVAVDLTDPLLPSGYHVDARLLEMAVDAAAGTVDWTLAVAAPPPNPQTSLTGRLASLDSRQTRAFHRQMEAPPPNIPGE
jgi:hypothetical protein